MLKPELGKEKSASKAVSIADAKLMASHIQEAHQLRQRHGARHFSVLQSDGQQQGLLGLDMLERMNVPQAQWADCDWKWFFFYAKHDDSFTVAAACLQGQIRQSKAASLAPKTNQQGTVLALNFQFMHERWPPERPWPVCSEAQKRALARIKTDCQYFCAGGQRVVKCTSPKEILKTRRMDYGGDEVGKALPLVAAELEPGLPSKEHAAKLPAIVFMILEKIQTH